MYMEPISGGKTRQQTVSTAQTNQTVQTMKTPEQSSTPKAAETKKAESMDGVMDVQIAKESDESVTLSIPADRQLIDEQKNVDLDKLKKVMEKAVASLPHSAAKFGVHCRRGGPHRRGCQKVRHISRCRHRKSDP